MVDMETKKDINKTLKYVIDRFILADLEYNRILELSTELKSSFGIYSEQEVKELVKNYLLLRGYDSKVN